MFRSSELYSQTTPGKWLRAHGDCYDEIITKHGNNKTYVAIDLLINDALWIAAAHNEWNDLMAAVKERDELRERAEAAEKVLADTCAHCGWNPDSLECVVCDCRINQWKAERRRKDGAK